MTLIFDQAKIGLLENRLQSERRRLVSNKAHLEAVAHQSSNSDSCTNQHVVEGLQAQIAAARRDNEDTGDLLKSAERRYQEGVAYLSSLQVQMEQELELKRVNLAEYGKLSSTLKELKIQAQEFDEKNGRLQSYTMQIAIAFDEILSEFTTTVGAGDSRPLPRFTRCDRLSALRCVLKEVSFPNVRPSLSWMYGT